MFAKSSHRNGVDPVPLRLLSPFISPEERNNSFLSKRERLDETLIDGLDMWRAVSLYKSTEPDQKHRALTDDTWGPKCIARAHALFSLSGETMCLNTPEA